MKKGKFAASVITTGLLVVSLSMAAFAQAPADDTTETQTESRQEHGKCKDSSRSKNSSSQKRKKKDKKNSPGAKIAEAIAALSDGDAKTNAQAAYDAYDAAMETKIKAERNGAGEDELNELKAAAKEARKTLDEALKAAGIEITKPEKKQKKTTNTVSE